MTRAVLISLLLVLALGVAACGASEAESDEEVETATESETGTETVTETEVETTEQEASPIAASQVVEAFLEAEGGSELEAAGSDGVWEQLGLGEDPTQAELERYGTFSIYVVDPDREQAVESLLADKETLEPLEPDAEGVYWDYDELARSYVASKRYGTNVVLAWWNERREPGTDERFERLDALMQDVLGD